MKKKITIDKFCGQKSGTYKKYLALFPDPDKFKEYALNYPCLVKLQIPFYEKPILHLKWADIDKALKKHKLSKRKFSKLFGCQTQYLEGPYPHDCEAVFHRMLTGELTGTQLFWD